MGSDFATLPGGKGANQAVAAARLGADVRMVGRVGDDVFGPMLLENLEANGVDASDVVTSHPACRPVLPSSCWTMSGKTILWGYMGRTWRATEIQVAAASRALEGADALLLQMEIPLDVSLEAARIARRMGVRVIYDPAPPSEIPLSCYDAFDIIAPNQSEAEVLTGVTVDDIRSAYEAASILRERGARVALIKLGEQGVVYSADQGVGHVPAFEVDAIDTVAAGDGFAGALAVALAEGQPLEHALRFASAAGALVVTKRGAQDAMPDRVEVERLVAGLCTKSSYEPQ